MPTGLVLLVTTRDDSVVGGLGGARTDVGDVSEDVVLNLLRSASGTAGLPGARAREAMQQVSLSCRAICFPNYCSVVSVAMCMLSVERWLTGTTDKLVEYSTGHRLQQYKYEQQQQRQAEVHKEIRNSEKCYPKPCVECSHSEIENHPGLALQIHVECPVLQLYVCTQQRRLGHQTRCLCAI